MEDAWAAVLERAPTDAPDGPFRRFYDEVTTVPAWVDWDAIARGQEVFVRYAGAAELALLHLSLVGGFGAPKINKVLMATGYLASKQTYRRLFETNQMIVDCLPRGSLTPLVGDGWKACVRVRFMHTKVRHRLLRSERWQRDAWGVPINQEDMAATALSFQYNVLFAIQHIGINLSDQEMRDYTHLWRYIGHLMGILPEYNPCDSYARSKAALESIIMHVIDPDDTSEYLSHHVIRSLELKRPTRWSFEAHAQMARLFMGDELADKLKLPASRYYNFLHHVTFAVLRGMAFVSHLPVLRSALLSMNLAGLQEITRLGLENRAASFQVTHAPSADKLAEHEDAAKRKRAGLLDKYHGVDTSEGNGAVWTQSRSLAARLFSVLGTPGFWPPAAGAAIVLANLVVFIAFVYGFNVTAILRRLLNRRRRLLLSK